MTALDDGSPVGRGAETGTRTEPPTPAVSVSAHQSAPGRVVFVEDGNSDAWIATDLTVGLSR
jgi:hypothetical protein